MIESDWFLTAHIFSLILLFDLSDYQELAPSLQGDFYLALEVGAHLQSQGKAPWGRGWGACNRTVKEPMKIK